MAPRRAGVSVLRRRCAAGWCSGRDGATGSAKRSGNDSDGAARSGCNSGEQPPPFRRCQTAAPAESEGPQTLHLLVGRSLVISSPTKIKRVSLADPAIAEAIVVSPYQVLLNGKAPGGVSLLLWDEADQSQAFEVSVDIDILGLTQKIHEVFPGGAGAGGDLKRHRDSVRPGFFRGRGRQDSGSREGRGAESHQPDGSSRPPDGEILLEVKFADVNRTLENQLGINILSLPGAKNIGSNFDAAVFAAATRQCASTGTGSQRRHFGLGLKQLAQYFHLPAGH